jgi:hypothetical protein
MPKYVLEADFDYDFSLLAISAHVPDYKMCIEINRLLNIDLIRDTPVDLSEKEMSAPLLFSCFTFQDEDEQCDYTLLSNTSSNSVAASNRLVSPPSLFDNQESQHIRRLLVPELPQCNFFLILYADNHAQKAYQIQNKIKTATFVLSVQTIDVKNLASKKNLIV